MPPQPPCDPDPKPPPQPPCATCCPPPPWKAASPRRRRGSNAATLPRRCHIGRVRPWISNAAATTSVTFVPGSPTPPPPHAGFTVLASPKSSCPAASLSTPPHPRARPPPLLLCRCEAHYRGSAASPCSSAGARPGAGIGRGAPCSSTGARRASGAPSPPSPSLGFAFEIVSGGGLQWLAERCMKNHRPPVPSRQRNAAAAASHGEDIRRCPIPAAPVPAASFTFDHVFDGATTNTRVCGALVQSIIRVTIDGFNGTVFAYGQTSSGKTQTMSSSDADPGIIPLAVRDLFDTACQVVDREFIFRVSYMEIYNEDINDLLTPGS